MTATPNPTGFVIEPNNCPVEQISRSVTLVLRQSRRRPAIRAACQPGLQINNLKVASTDVTFEYCHFYFLPLSLSHANGIPNYDYNIMRLVPAFLSHLCFRYFRPSLHQGAAYSSS